MEARRSWPWRKKGLYNDKQGQAEQDCEEEKEAAAMAEMRRQEKLVKQHAKVAEEAVSGWEKAEAEAGGLRKQLEATEERVSHLDAALKECMRQLRAVREEQEGKVHEAVVAKSRAWEEEKAELVGRLAEAEKEVASANYHLSLLRKEVEARDEEREYSKRAADAGNKQVEEAGRKVAKAEAECQRLRLLLRKRLPGPGALAQMRAEVEGLGWEEENAMLKEALGKRNGELQAARLMCARTASKLSRAEEELEKVRQGKTVLRSVTEMDRADEWATALVTQLDQFKRGSAGSEVDMMSDFAEMEKLAAGEEEEQEGLRAGVGKKVVEMVKGLVLAFGGEEEEEQGVGRNAEVEAGVKAAVEAVNAMVQGKVDMGAFVGELVACVGVLVALGRRRVEETKAKLEEAVAQLQAQARKEDVVSEDEFLEHELISLSASKADLLERRVRAADSEMNRLHAKVAALEVELEGERMRHEQVMAKFQDIQHHLYGNDAVVVDKKQEEEDVAPQSRKDREIAAAAQQLAECQRTILMLGKQLQTLSSSPRDGPSFHKVGNGSGNGMDEEDVRSNSNGKDMVVGWNGYLSPQGSCVSTASYASENEEGKGSVMMNGGRRFSSSANARSHYATPRANASLSPSSSSSSFRADSVIVGALSFTTPNAVERGPPSSLPSSPSPSETTSLTSPPRSPATVLTSKLRLASFNGRPNLSKSLDATDNPFNHRNSSSFTRFYSRMRSTGSAS